MRVFFPLPQGARGKRICHGKEPIWVKFDGVAIASLLSVAHNDKINKKAPCGAFLDDLYLNNIILL